MAEPRTDSLGDIIEAGDIVYSAVQGGGSEIGRVEKVHPSGRVTLKVKLRVPVYAYQRGAPGIPSKGHRAVRDEQGQYVLEIVRDRWGSREVVKYEEYDYLAKDYTLVGHEYQWIKKQGSEINMLILERASGETTQSFADAVNEDYDRDLSAE